MKKILLTQGKFTLIDDEDYEYISQWKWRAYKGGHSFYAMRNSCRIKGQIRTTVYMHRSIIKLIAGDRKQVDHINRNGLDNRRSNLRICSNSENSRNARTRKGTSKFKGVYWNQVAKRWVARIVVDYKILCLGSYVKEIEAAYAYDAAAVEHFGEFANLNFPEEK